MAGHAGAEAADGVRAMSEGRGSFARRRVAVIAFTIALAGVLAFALLPRSSPLLDSFADFRRVAIGGKLNANVVVDRFIEVGSDPEEVTAFLQASGLSYFATTIDKHHTDDRAGKSAEYREFYVTRYQIWPIISDVYRVVIGVTHGKVDFIHSEVQTYSI
jgi:hypothetical protein